MPDSDRIRRMLQSTMDQHITRYADDPSEIVPMYFLYRGDAVHTVALTPFTSGNPAERTALAAQVAEIARQEDCDGFTFSSEAWTLPPEMSHTHDGGSISDRPDRVEVLNVHAGTRDGGAGVYIADMERPDEETVVLKPREMMIQGEGGFTLESRFNIFNPAKMDHPIKDGLREALPRILQHAVDRNRERAEQA